MIQCLAAAITPRSGTSGSPRALVPDGRVELDVERARRHVLQVARSDAAA